MSRRAEFRRVVGKAQNVAGIGPDAGRLPGQQHVAIFGDLVLPLFGGQQIVGIDVLQPDEDAGYAGAFGLGDEIRDLVTQRVDLDQETHVHAVVFAQFDDAVEDRLPVLVAGEIVVGDEEAVDAVLVVLAQDALDVVRRAPPRFPPLHVDDGAERALERAAAPGVEGGHVADGLAYGIAREIRRHRVFQRRQIVDVIVDRLERTGGGITQDLVHAPFRFAGKQSDAHVERLLQVGHDGGKHRQHAGDVETPDDHRDAGLAQRFGDVQRARILVRLHADQADKAEILVGAHVGDDAVDAHPRIGLVDGGNLDVDVGPENPALRAVVEKAIDAGQRIRRHRRAVPADDITVVVIMRRLDQHDAETLSCGNRLGTLLR